MQVVDTEDGLDDATHVGIATLGKCSLQRGRVIGHRESVAHGQAQHAAGHHAQGQHDHGPDSQLGQANQCHADDLAHHQLERLARTDDNLDDAVGLLLDDAIHDHGTIHQHEHVDQERQDKADAHGNLGAGLCLAAILTPLDALDIDINARLVNHPLQVGHAITGDMSAGDGVAQLAAERHLERGVDGLVTVDGNLVQRVDVGRDDDHGTQALAGVAVELTRIGDSVTPQGDKMEQVGVVYGPAIATRLVDDGHILGVAALMVEIADADGQQHAGNHQDGDEYGHDDE